MKTYIGLYTMTESISRHWGANAEVPSACPKRPYFGRLGPLRATRSESVSSLLLVIVYNLHNLNLSFAPPKNKEEL